MKTKVAIYLFTLLMISQFGYYPAYAQKRLCIVGDACRYGWDKDNASPLIQDPGSVSVFHYDAWLNQGDFKFIPENQNDWIPTWNKGANDSTLVKRLSFSAPDDKFHISVAGNYSITLDTTLLTIHIAPMPDPGTTPVSSIKMSTDKSCYHPGEQVMVSIDQPLTGTVKVRYRHLATVITEHLLSGTSWTWTPPTTDFQGYLIDVYKLNYDGTEHIFGSIAVDVSSDWTRFPRYGFLSKYPQLSISSMDSVIKNLARHHINGLQFYDWHLAHHKPLAGTPANPSAVWLDIANRETWFSAVSGYISMAHNYNMKAMFYNLCYGALDNAASDGVQDGWYLFTDPYHTSKDSLILPSPMFKSNIWFLNPSNTGWQQYINGRNQDVYQTFSFDGYHIDQIGNRNRTLYNYNGQIINTENTFASFINAMKSDQPDKNHVFNAVNQYGQQNVAQTPVDFLYTEVWSPNDGYKDLATIINSNSAYSGNTKKTILAAYMNYDLANAAGYFNTAGVLMTEAVIFSSGGAHLELGEHMLSKEYFPSCNLLMDGELKEAMIAYYDFLVAYQNLLRDGGTINYPSVLCMDNQFVTNPWPPQIGKISVTGRSVGNRKIIHLINFGNANSLNWRDANGQQNTPTVYHNVQLRYSTTSTVQKVWVASPDTNNGTPVSLNFTQTAGSVSFVLPSLQYWTMIVIE